MRFSTFEGVFVIFQSQSHPDRRTKRMKRALFVCKAKKKIDRADLLATTHREINSFFLERKYKRTQPYLAFFRRGCKETLLSVAEMTRRKTGKKSIFQFFLFSNFSPPFVVLEKLHHHAQRPSQKNAGTSQKTLCLEKERVRVREKTRNVSRSRAGVAFFSSFVVKRVRVENSFFLFERSDRWSLVWPSPSWVGFKWQNVKAQSQEFFSLEFCTSFCVFGGLPFLEGRVHFILIRF